MFAFACDHLVPEELFLSNRPADRGGLKPASLTVMFRARLSLNPGGLK